MVERVLVIDPGESATLIVVAERIFGEIQIRHHVSIPASLGDPQQLVPETLAQLHAEYAPLRTILIIPQSDTVSQRIVLSQQSISEFVAEEANRFQEIEGNLPVVDYQALDAGSQGHYWLTYCQPDIISQRLKDLGLDLDDIDDVTSATQGFWGYYESLSNTDEDHPVYVIDVGQQHSSILAVQSGKPVFATSFSSLLSLEGKQIPEAQIRHWFKRLASAPSTLHGVPAEAQQFSEKLQIVLAGDEDLLLPLESYVHDLPGPNPSVSHSHIQEEDTPGQYSVALGVARAALGSSSLQISLLPDSFRSRRDQRQTWSRLRGWTTALAIATTVLILVGSWQKLTLYRLKQDLLTDTNRAIEKMEETERTLGDFAIQYERVRPILRFQQETRELIETMAILRESVPDQDYWLVLLADNLTYATKSIPTTETNTVEESEISIPINPLQKESGFVAEFSFLDDGENMRSKLTALVEQLNATGRYANVDTIPDDVRRPLAHTNVVIADQHVALSLQLHRNYFQRQLSIVPSHSPKGALESENNRDDATFSDRNGRIPKPNGTP